MEVRLLLCEGQQSLGRSSRQAIWQLLGVVGAERLQVRIYRPEAGALPTLHSKIWGSDGEVYYGGSFNFSRNAPILEEHLVVVNAVQKFSLLSLLRWKSLLFSIFALEVPVFDICCGSLKIIGDFTES